MASRRSFMPALRAMRQAAANQSGAAGRARTLSSSSSIVAARPLAAASRRESVAARLPSGVRRYSQQPADNKIWNFEDIQKLTQEPKPNVVIVDAREPGELQSTGHVPGAVNIPVASQPDSFHISEDEFEDRFGYPRPGKDQEVVFYCKAGVRSRAAAGLARDAGWANVGEYPGSWLDWAGKGGKVERS